MVSDPWRVSSEVGGKIEVPGRPDNGENFLTLDEECLLKNFLLHKYGGNICLYCIWSHREADGEV